MIHFLFVVFILFDYATSGATAASNDKNRPVLTITLRDGQFLNENYLDYFCPTLSAKYSKTTQSLPIDNIEYGFILAPSTQRPSASLWTRLTKTLPSTGWKFTAGAAIATLRQQFHKHTPYDGQMSSQQRDVTSSFKADVDLRAENYNQDFSARIFASDLSISRVEFTKGFDLSSSSQDNKKNHPQNNRITLNPRYNPETNAADVIFGYTQPRTTVKIRASTNSQEVSIAQQLNEQNVIIPTIVSNGDVSLRWERQLLSGTEDEDKSSSSSYLATTLKPNDCINVEWKDENWNGVLNIPIDGRDSSYFGVACWFRAEHFEKKSDLILVSVKTEDGGGVEVLLEVFGSSSSSDTADDDDDDDTDGYDELMNGGEYWEGRKGGANCATLVVTVYDSEDSHHGGHSPHVVRLQGCVLPSRAWYYIAVRHTLPRFKGFGFSLSAKEEVSIMLDGKVMLTEPLKFQKLR